MNRVSDERLQEILDALTLAVPLARGDQVRAIRELQQWRSLAALVLFIDEHTFTGRRLVREIESILEVE